MHKFHIKLPTNKNSLGWPSTFSSDSLFEQYFPPLFTSLRPLCIFDFYKVSLYILSLNFNIAAYFGQHYKFPWWVGKDSNVFYFDSLNTEDWFYPGELPHKYSLLAGQMQEGMKCYQICLVRYKPQDYCNVHIKSDDEIIRIFLKMNMNGASCQ